MFMFRSTIRVGASSEHSHSHSQLWHVTVCERAHVVRACVCGRLFVAFIYCPTSVNKDDQLLATNPPTHRMVERTLSICNAQHSPPSIADTCPDSTCMNAPALLRTYCVPTPHRRDTMTIALSNDFLQGPGVEVNVPYRYVL